MRPNFLHTAPKAGWQPMLWTTGSQMLLMLIRQSHPEARQKRPRKFYAMIVKVFTLARVAKLADARDLKSDPLAFVPDCIFL
ncbi:MAG: hypothetical protein DMG88_23165 [Acidobacteria bacterium]|nr:MAG: hypothetical protein DMG88_23165 [Acidobacteriota bacterium]